jgi:hypothetical protein
VLGGRARRAGTPVATGPDRSGWSKADLLCLRPPRPATAQKLAYLARPEAVSPHPITGPLEVTDGHPGRVAAGVSRHGVPLGWRGFWP